MNIEGIIQKVEQLINELSELSSTIHSQSAKQFDEHLKYWEARAYEELRDCGLADAAERFAKTSHRTRVNNYLGNLCNKAEAKGANLTALLEDIKKNPAFYGQKVKRRFAETDPAAASTSETGGGLLVLISHSSKDEVLASTLIDLLRSGLGLLPNQIRCSSVDGYRLPAGVNTDAQLRAEVRASKVLIGVITPNSLASPYVLFELGARWGAGEIMVPLLAGVTPEKLRGPLSGMNALLCNSEAQLHQALNETGAHLHLAVQSPAAYLKQLRNVIAETSRISIEKVPLPASRPGEEKPRELRFSLTVVGEPPSPQMVNVRANQVVRAVHLDYLLTNGACIASDNLTLEGEVFDIPIEDHQVMKLWNTHRSDRNPNDHSGPAKLRVTLAHNRIETPYTLPIQMDAYFRHSTQYKRLSGSETFRGE
jgi:hypothetical protein